jgi:hypothetical protein
VVSDKRDHAFVCALVRVARETADSDEGIRMVPKATTFQTSHVADREALVISKSAFIFDFITELRDDGR